MNYYINPDDLKIEIIKSQQNNQMTEKLGSYILLIGRKLLSSSKFYNYNADLKEDMLSYGLLRCVKYFNKFDINRGNPFNYFTRILDSSYLNEYSKFNRYNIKKERIKNDFILKMKEEFPQKTFINHDFREED